MYVGYGIFDDLNFIFGHDLTGHAMDIGDRELIINDRGLGIHPFTLFHAAHYCDCRHEHERRLNAFERLHIFSLKKRNPLKIPTL